MTQLSIRADSQPTSVCPLGELELLHSNLMPPRRFFRGTRTIRKAFYQTPNLPPHHHPTSKQQHISPALSPVQAKQVMWSFLFEIRLVSCNADACSSSVFIWRKCVLLLTLARLMTTDRAVKIQERLPSSKPERSSDHFYALVCPVTCCAWLAVACGGDPLTLFRLQSSRDPKMIQELSQAAARATRQGWLGSTLCAFASLSLSLSDPFCFDPLGYFDRREPGRAKKSKAMAGR